ncbi:ABC transporter permease [Paenibacillus sp. OAS669]|uniref:ABC transporter permease n=1 Tax=Paenibacillus sp. OAS669 TaxID=2663821 RepID=UPI00178B6CFA|nr:ABC transporter permease subunit [Paenibacillus sp. OAS669]MBE1445739.1 putative spermidine/putrescine transport system permease protein [Paenibacillus sp. OAS669]
MSWNLRIFSGKAWIEWAVLLIFAIFFMGPLLNLLVLAFSGKWQYPAILPQEWSLSWWTYVLTQNEVIESISLSFGIAAVVTLLSVILCLPAAYAFARMRFRLSKLFLFSFLLTHAFPKMGLYVSIAVLFYKLNLMNTFLGVVLIHMVNTLMYMTWIPAAAFKSVHLSQEESARDAGAGPFRVFWYITLPMALPGIVVASIFTFLSSLDEAQGTFMVGIPDFRTMPLIMYTIVQNYPTTAGGVFSILLTLPTLLLLLAARRFISADVLSSGFTIK